MNKQLKSRLNTVLGKKINLVISKAFPRHSTRRAKEFFNDKEIIVIEIGTCRGENALNILKTLNVKKIYLVDPYKQYEDYFKSEGASKKDIENNESHAKRLLKDYSDKIVWLKKFSNEAFKEIKEKVDFIYIDGNHEYDYVKQDIKNYFPLLKSKGIISGHDITNERFSKGIMKAISVFFITKDLIPEVTRTDWIIEVKNIQKEINENEHKHWCGCITIKYKDGVAFKEMCKRHKENNKYCWIALQHPNE